MIDGISMIDRNPPDHTTHLRRLVQKAFTPGAIIALTPRVTELVDRILDEIAAAGEVNLVQTLAFPLPFAVIAEMLGDHRRWITSTSVS